MRHVVTMEHAGKPLDDPYALSKEPAGKAQKMPLTSILTLDAKFFPEELFTSSQKRSRHALQCTLRLLCKHAHFAILGSDCSLVSTALLDTGNVALMVLPNMTCLSLQRCSKGISCAHPRPQETFWRSR